LLFWDRTKTYQQSACWFFLHNIDMAEQSLWLQIGDGEIVDTNPSHYITTLGILVTNFCLAAHMAG